MRAGCLARCEGHRAARVRLVAADASRADGRCGHPSLGTAAGRPAVGCALAASHAVKATVRRESVSSRLMHLGPMVVAATLLWAPRLGVPLLDARWLPRTPW